jgi:hypothetical protein
MVKLILLDLVCYFGIPLVEMTFPMSRGLLPEGEDGERTQGAEERK